MRANQVVWLFRLVLLFSSTRAAAEEIPVRWGVDFGLELNNVLTESSTNKPFLGFAKFSGIFSVGRELSLDLSSGFLFTKKEEQTTTASPVYVLTAAEGYLASSEMHYGLSVQGEFSLEGAQPIFNERRLLIGPAAKFKLGLDSGLRVKIAAGYVAAWQPTAFNNGFAVMLSGQYVQE